MTEYWYPTAFSDFGPEEEAAIQRVVKSVRFTMGPEVKAFEEEFAAFHDMKHGIMVNSGSSANLLAISALCNKEENPLKRGDQVVVPAIAWSTTYAPLVQHGLELILVDSDDTWNANLYATNDFKEAKLFIGCSILGNPADLIGWLNAAGIHGAYFMEDNCESLGAKTHLGHLCGTYGDLNTFSFFYSHQISGIEGGMVLTNDDELAMLCRILRAHGWTRDVKKSNSFDEDYNFIHLGYNLRNTEINAAVAREQLKKLPRFIGARQHNLVYFQKLTKDLPITFPTPNGELSPFSLNFTVDAGKEVRHRLVEALRSEGIDCRLPTGGSFTKHAYGMPWQQQKTPNADRIHDTGLFLGNAPYEIPDMIERAVEVMKKVL